MLNDKKIGTKVPVRKFQNGFAAISGNELKELQSNLLRLLSEFDEICRRHDITYYLDGGSVIGALRHRGFIPWDDDVDILIKKDDFDKLLSVIDQEMAAQGDRCFAYMSRDDNHHRPFARYVDTNHTHLTRNLVAESNYPAGIFIDIFILDGVASDALSKHIRTLKKSEDWFHNRLNGVVAESGILEYLFIHIITNIFGSKFVFSRFDNILSKSNNKSHDFYVPRNGFNFAVYDGDVFQAPLFVEFEGRYFPVPTKPEKYLRSHYSTTWFISPDKNKRASNHFSLTTSALTAKEFEQKFPFKLYRRLVHRRQAIRHFLNRIRHPLRRLKESACSDLKAKILSLEFASSVKKNLISLSDCEDSQFSKNTITIVAPYLCAQASLLNTFKLCPRAIKIDGQCFTLILKALVQIGRYYDALALVKIPDQVLIADSLLADLNRIEALECAMQDKEYDKAKAIISEISPEFELSPTVLVYSVQLGLKSFRSSKKAIEFYQSVLERTGENYEILKLLADANFTQGNFAEATTLYQQIIDESLNGLTILAAKDCLVGIEALPISCETREKMAFS